MNNKYTQLLLLFLAITGSPITVFCSPSKLFQQLFARKPAYALCAAAATTAVATGVATGVVTTQPITWQNLGLRSSDTLLLKQSTMQYGPYEYPSKIILQTRNGESIKSNSVRLKFSKSPNISTTTTNKTSVVIACPPEVNLSIYQDQWKDKKSDDLYSQVTLHGHSPNGGLPKILSYGATGGIIDVSFAYPAGIRKRR